MEPLKEMFNAAYYQKLAMEIGNVYAGFPEKKFVNEAVISLQHLSLNQRMRLTSELVHRHLSLDFHTALEVLKKVITNMPRGYQNLFFCDYVALYGTDHIDISLKSLHYFTRYGSAEFAIREFLKKDFAHTISVMKTWARDKDHHVRRLASEGSRPRLPWSFKLSEVISDPSLTKEILEILKTDPELYVRKSVANHLNDLSKDHPDYMLKLIKGWDQKNEHTAWIIRHASRSLIKKGHAGSLSVLSFEKDSLVSIKKLQITPAIKLGDTLTFDFELLSGKNKDQKLAVDYIIHYRKKSGGLSPKVFKLIEFVLKPGVRTKIEKRQLFRDFTTRKHFPGRHLLEIQVNGKVVARKSFDLEV